MKATSIKYFETLIPGGSCGTGYSQPDRFIITFENGSSIKVLIDIWYRTPDGIKEEFLRGINRVLDIIHIDNLDELFSMYVDEIVKNRCCPYTKEQILRS